MDHVEEGGDVIRAPVLVLEVVRVFPDIEAENGRPVERERCVLVGRRFEAQTGAVDRQPGPSAPKHAQGRLGEFLAEVVEAAELVFDRSCEGLVGRLFSFFLSNCQKRA